MRVGAQGSALVGEDSS